MKEVWIVTKDNYIVDVFESEVRGLRKALELKQDPANQYMAVNCYKYEVK